MDQLIETLPKTSPLTIKRFKSLGINTFWDLLNYFPFRYEDYSLLSPINQIQEGETVTVKGIIVSLKNEFTRRGFRLQKIEIDDGSGKAELVWFNQMYLIKLFREGLTLSAGGKVERNGRNLSIKPEEFEIVGAAPTIHTGRLVPVYPEKRGLSSKTIREKIFYAINQLDMQKLLPDEIMSYNNLIDETTAYKNIHFPENTKLARQSRQRLAFDELFTIQLSNAMIKQEWKKETVGNRFIVGVGYSDPQLMDGKTRLAEALTKRARLDSAKRAPPLQQFINNLPFKLTAAQKRVIDEIISDLRKTRPMNRFLQGEVGSGKTVVAAVAAYLAHLNGYQTLLMAPTEILAEQHYKTFQKLFSGTGIARNTPATTLITASHKPVRDELTKSNIVIGTQALLNAKLDFGKIGLVVIDEQHRFGVAQRAILKQKGTNPHLLTMTATPIPRTVALTLYGELDLSVIDEMPKGREQVKTYLVERNKRNDAYRWIEKNIVNENVQAFIVCPLIEESEVETMKTIRAVKKEYEYLKNQIFPRQKVGLLHGKLKAKEKNQVMLNFKDGKIDILVSTSVVEVGIDIPNATIILVESAERYGMAQLHQLRGRVGRGKKQSYCLLFSEAEDKNSLDRLRFFAHNSIGSELAEYDLKRRGPGQIYGTKQHGYADLKIASFSDYGLIRKTKSAASYFMNRYQLNQFPELKNRVDKLRINKISRD